jgi:hypothetical protein
MHFKSDLFTFVVGCQLRARFGGHPNIKIGRRRITNFRSLIFIYVSQTVVSTLEICYRESLLLHRKCKYSSKEVCIFFSSRGLVPLCRTSFS